jgi:hypothetical protein
MNTKGVSGIPDLHDTNHAISHTVYVNCSQSLRVCLHTVICCVRFVFWLIFLFLVL